MVALKFAACICLVYFTILVNAGSKPNFSRSNLQALAMDKLESESEGTFKHVLYFADVFMLRFVLAYSKSLKSEQ